VVPVVVMSVSEPYEAGLIPDQLTRVNKDGLQFRIQRQELRKDLDAAAIISYYGAATQAADVVGYISIR
jgi:hypothetical protein